MRPLINTLSPGDRLPIMETGWFSHIAWRHPRLGLRVDYVPNVAAGRFTRNGRERLTSDRAHEIKAVVVVHNETSTGVTSRIADVRRAMDNARHPALLIVDTISSLASIDYRHDEWGVDVTAAGSQKGSARSGTRVQRGVGQGARRREELEDAEGILGLGAHVEKHGQWLLSHTPATNLLHNARSACDAVARRD